MFAVRITSIAVKRLVFLIITSCLILSCTSHKKEEAAITIKSNYKPELNTFFKENFYNTLTSEEDFKELDSIKWITNFYKNNNFSTIWFNDSIQLTKSAEQLISQLTDSKKYGIDSRLYPINLFNELSNKVEKESFSENKYLAATHLEILLTHYYMQHGKHLNYGLLSMIDSITEVPRKEFAINIPEYLQKSFEKDSLISRLLALQPKHKEYHYLQKGLEKFLKTSELTTDNINVINFRDDSLRSVSSAKDALILHKYLTEEAKDSLFLKALTKFQEDHGLKPDSLIGIKTAKALSLSPYEYYKRLQATLERWRWKEEWPKDYLFVNIPSYSLEVVKNYKLVREHKVVVGTVRNQTPEIVDTLEYIIAYPYWHVPRKISVEEILVKAKKDSTYLKRNNYDIMTYSREHIDPTTVDWSSVNKNNFNYFIRQQGGGANALGLVKFIFPNKHSIYLHDTPTKYYFDLETRAYSHGCIRVHKAMDLAKFLLEEDENKYTIDSVYKYIDKKKEKHMSLNKKLPIFLYYFTAEADSTGNVKFYDDVYGLDKKLIKELINTGN